MSEAVTSEQESYPIVDAWPLDEAQRSGPWGVGRRRRSATELPRPSAGHHVLVYRVDGGYLVDTTGRGARDDDVVRATHVSVVSMRRDAPVRVEFPIPSADAAQFLLRVHFGCTVIDPALVVQQGLTDPAQVLESYVRGYHSVMQMGLAFTLDQINEARRHIHDALDAYRTVCPPMLDGFEVRLTNVEVETPASIAERAARLRTLADDDQVTRTRIRFDFAQQHAVQGNDHILERDAQEHEQEQKLSALEHRHLAEREEQLHRDRLADAAQRNAFVLGDRQLEYQLAQVQKVQQLMGNDPAVAARFLAAVGAENGASAFADSIESRERAEIERADQREAADRELELERERHQREVEARAAERRAELEARKHEARIARRAAEAEQARLEREREYAVQHLRSEWDRADAIEDRQAKRADAKARLEAKLEFLRELARRGQFDLVEMNVDQLVSELSGLEMSGTQQISDAAPLDAAPAAPAAPEEGDQPQEKPGSGDA